MPIIDHLTLRVKDLAMSKSFYEKALAPLGFGVQMEWQGFVGFGPSGKPSFWIAPLEKDQASAISHIAFGAKSRAEVDAFHAAALEAGGRDEGKPGLREHYHPGYYGAFVFDPDGNNIEAVTHKPE